METYRAIYRVDFVPPVSPAQLSLQAFEEALDTLLNTAAIARRHEGLPDDGIRIARTEGLAVVPVDDRASDFVVRHTVRLHPQDGCPGNTDDGIARLCRRLADDLDLHPRQVEGPFNIVDLTVRPDDDPAELTGAAAGL